ncbi:Serine acetyltransferase [Corynebacterium mycetoides]|uniref:Serine acetyltransferase n=1 Tax=Corynebacterium mycetoides TaxID=38302 RepID=A0A1G9NJ40_9CORY|nr:hypothetical protein [Corynebacterium mycetoides]SDL86380.1 Serine acetyltransferase [Corynebacterium mycetoides]
MHTPEGRIECLLDDSAKEYHLSRIESTYVEGLVNSLELGALQIYQIGREAYLRNDHKLAYRCERLNRIINGCHLPSSVYVGRGTDIAYGGLGVLFHAETHIGDWSTIGTNVSLGGAPVIGDHVYIATGARIVGHESKIGDFSIIGANAVVTGDVSPGSIVAGVPAKPIKRITPENIDGYIGKYFSGKGSGDPVFRERIKENFLNVYYR